MGERSTVEPTKADESTLERSPTPELVIVGSGRCGTQSLAWKTGAEHEPRMDPTVYLGMARSHGWLTDHDCRIAMSNFSWPERIADYKQSELISATSEIWDCHYVWIVRNPADTVASMVRKRWYLPADDLYPFGYFKIYRRIPEGMTETHATNQAGNRTRGDIVGDFTTKEWANMSQVERCGWWWNYSNKRIAQQLARLPNDRWRLLHLEDAPDDFPQINQSDSIPVTGFERYTKEMAEELGYA